MKYVVNYATIVKGRIFRGNFVVDAEGESEAVKKAAEQLKADKSPDVRIKSIKPW